MNNTAIVKPIPAAAPEDSLWGEFVFLVALGAGGELFEVLVPVLVPVLVLVLALLLVPVLVVRLAVELEVIDADVEGSSEFGRKK
jgi:hypothetical protein